MAIAHVATEYVFSDFLLKDPTEAKYRGVRLELAVDKIVTLLAVGLPLFLISLAFAQEVSVGVLLSCGRCQSCHRPLVRKQDASLHRKPAENFHYNRQLFLSCYNHKVNAHFGPSPTLIFLIKSIAVTKEELLYGLYEANVDKPFS
uniref:Pannexin 1b n=1 Tax=Sparus aurata TaxID=8175 RepID=A0A671WGM7_SPAAU